MGEGVSWRDEMIFFLSFFPWIPHLDLLRDFLVYLVCASTTRILKHSKIWRSWDGGGWKLHRDPDLVAFSMHMHFQ